MRRSGDRSNFSYDSNGYVQAYTDGSCENNGRTNARAGVGVWFGPDHPMNISQPATHRATNNSGEIEACTRALESASSAGERNVTINTDSEFVVKSMNEWMPNWKNNGWKTSSGNPVKNRTEFQELDHAVRGMDNVQFKHVPGHRGHEGNEGADRLARQGAQQYRGRRY
ncbi:ribonuclease H1 [Carabus blaptoides fortunei]